ncbi:MAG TPA: amino acid ABC transporter substrate-binding protein [Alphaproteobacteria bacterium]|nr:amino acid ABC transporter substrate-binding protein [Alphaproteobacteria bacterium]
MAILRMTAAALASVGLIGVIATPAGAKVEGDTIVLGAAVSKSGKYSTNGKHTINGYNLAVERLNAMGGVSVGGKKYKLKIIYYDDESRGARGAQLAERLINQDKVKYMLGPYSSGLTKAIVPVTEKYKIPMVEANGASRSLFTKGYKYLFAVLSTSEQYLASAIALAAEKAKEQGRKPSSLRVALAFENDPFSQDVRAGVIDDAKRYGMKIVVDGRLPRDLSDMKGILQKVKLVKPDILVVSGHSKGAALAIRQIAALRVNVPMLAMTHCDSAQIIKKYGKKAEYTLCASQWAPTLSYKDKVFGSAADFAKTFEDKYGYAPPYQAAESAAAVLVYADAFQRANAFDTGKVRAALAATQMQTFYGNVKFDPSGKNIVKPMVLFQIQDGQYKVVAPTKWASSKIRHPMPGWDKR